MNVRAEAPQFHRGDAYDFAGKITGNTWAARFEAGGIPMPLQSSEIRPQTELQPTLKSTPPETSRPSLARRMREGVKNTLLDFRTGVKSLTTTPDQFLPTYQQPEVQTHSTDTTEPVGKDPRRWRRRGQQASAILGVVGAFMAGPAAGTAEAKGKQFSVSASGLDTHTGIKVQKGQEFTIDVIDGAWTMNNGSDGSRPLDYVGPTGYPGLSYGDDYCKVDPGNPYGTLMVRIDDGIPNDVDFQAGVGNGETFTARESGYLILYPNDKRDRTMNCRTNNSGSILAKITT